MLREAGENGKAALAKYSRAGYLLAGEASNGQNEARIPRGLELLDAALERLVSRSALPRLSSFGVKESHIEGLAARAAAKTNPVPLGAAEYAELLRQVL